MARYDYYCEDCDITEEQIHGMTEKPIVGCPKCGRRMKKLLSLSAGGFIIKGGSSSIHWKEKRLRQKRNEELDRKQKERYGDGPKVTPNIAGVPYDSWSDAQKVAKECNMNTSSFDDWVRKEKKESPKIYTGR